MMEIRTLLLCLLALDVAASMTGSKVYETLLVMDDNDRIVGKEVREYQKLSGAVGTPPPLPTIPANTNSDLMKIASIEFPKGSPNITVDSPWIKKGHSCIDNDSKIVHHFEDTLFLQTNDVCTLSPGVYTWTLTADYQLSFGTFRNGYEFESKHANLALMRPGLVAGEILVVPNTEYSKAGRFWNLLSGTYSLPISEAQDPNNPMAYLENVMYPAMTKVWETTACFSELTYADVELFPDLVPSSAYISKLCSSNYFAMNEMALTWNKAPEVGSNLCDSWSEDVCSKRI